MGALFDSMNDTSPELKDKWAHTLDWLFNEDKFKGWSSYEIGCLTTKIKRMDGFVENKNYIHGTAKDIDFLSLPKKEIQAVFTSGNSECRDFIRHIRNGIAHGRTECFKKKDILYVEIRDYSDNSKQSAYLCFPVSYIIQIFELYDEMKKAKLKNKQSRR